MELVPHITLNPSFNIDMLEFHDPSTVQQSNEDLIVDVVANSRNQGRRRSGEVRVCWSKWAKSRIKYEA